MTNDCAESGDSFPNRTPVLSVAQALTRGTRFAALVPRANMANPGKARSRRSTAGVAGSAAGTPVHVLVVEDHADTRDVLDTLLRTEGYDVTIAVDGVEAIERYRQRPADVVLIDVFMPRKDGIETIRELRAEFGDPLCIAMSADGDPTRRSARDRARCASRSSRGCCSGRSKAPWPAIARSIVPPSPAEKIDLAGHRWPDVTPSRRPCWRHPSARGGRRPSR